MPKPVIACMFKVLHHRLLRYIFYTRQKVVSRCYVIFCNGAYCTRVQTCAIVRFQNTWELWSCCVCRQHGQLASQIANLSKYRWVRIILAWNLSVRHRSLLGREAAHLGLSNPRFLSIQRSGAMAGGSEMPPSLDCTL